MSHREQPVSDPPSCVVGIQVTVATPEEDEVAVDGTFHVTKTSVATAADATSSSPRRRTRTWKKKTTKITTTKRTTWTRRRRRRRKKDDEESVLGDLESVRLGEEDQVEESEASEASEAPLEMLSEEAPEASEASEASVDEAAFDYCNLYAFWLDWVALFL